MTSPSSPTCLLVPIQSPAAIAVAVERLLKDPILLKRLVAGGLATAKSRPMTREWEELETLIQRFWREGGKASESKTSVINSLPLPPSASPRVASAAAPAEPAITLPEAGRVGNLILAQTYLEAKRLEEAWQSTCEAVSQRPFHPEAFLLFAQIALAAGDVALAKRCAERVRKLAPHWKQVRKFIKTLKGQGKPLKGRWALLPEPSATLRVSVCLITKNEEKFLGQCLASIKPLAWQIIVVDTGSTDRTVEIARQYGAEIHSFAWCDDFSAARNAALSHARGDWVLVVDADEELPPEEHEKLQNEMLNPGILGYRLPLINKGVEVDGCSYVPRFYRNGPALFYYGRIHEQVFPSIVVRAQEWAMESRLSEATLLHHGYSSEVMKDRNKIERNLLLLQRAATEMPNDANIMMNLGLELFRSGQVEEGISNYEEAFRLLSATARENVVPELREVLLTQLSFHFHTQKRYPDGVRLLTSPLAKGGELSASLNFALGLAYYELKQYEPAIEQMKLCLAKRHTRALSPINRDIHTGHPNHCLALCHRDLDQPAEAEKAFLAALQDEPGSWRIQYNYSCFLVALGRELEAFHLLHSRLGEHPAHDQTWQLGGLIALRKPQFLEFACDWTAEAVQNLPDNRCLQLQRAEALFLSQQVEEAWKLLETGTLENPAQLAARLLCGVVLEKTKLEVPPDQEAAISQAAVVCYQRLISYQANELLEQINQRLASLKQVLPTAGALLSAAMEEARLADPTPSPS